MIAAAAVMSVLRCCLVVIILVVIQRHAGILSHPCTYSYLVLCPGVIQLSGGCYSVSYAVQWRYVSISWCLGMSMGIHASPQLLLQWYT